MRPFARLLEHGVLRLQAAELTMATFRRTSPRTYHTLKDSPQHPWQSPLQPRRHQTYSQLARRSRLLRHQRRHKSTGLREEPSPNPTPHLGSPEAAPSLSQRLKKLSREYGWTALGVYLALSAIDFPFCWLAVRMLGVDRIGRWEHIIVRGFWDTVSIPFPGGEEQVRSMFRVVGNAFKSGMQSVGLTKQHEPKPQRIEGAVGGISQTSITDGAVANPQDWTWGVEEAQEEASKEGATLATQLALAYAIHKSFIFVRVPLTAAVLPRVVKTLRGWGWNIGKKTPKA